MEFEIKYQVYCVYKDNKQRIWVYDNEEQAQEQYNVCAEIDVMKTNKTKKVELQEVIVRKRKNGLL